MNRPVTIRRILVSQFMLLLLAASFATQAAAGTSPVSEGVTWLEAHQDALGGWDACEPSHGFALQALNETSYQAAPAYANLRERVLSLQSPRGNWADTHYPIAGLIETGMSPTAPQIMQGLTGLREVQQANGSWNGNIIDTQLAIGSFVAANQSSAPAVQNAIAWIKASQNADGGWGYQPGDSSDFDTYYACLVLAQVASADEALTKCREWITRRFVVSTLPCEIAIEIEALLAIGETAKAQTAAAGLAACQNADGSWFLYPGISTPYSAARCVTALRRARQAGIAGLDQNITAGSQWVLGCIDGSGDPTGRYEQVIETAEATMALIAAGRSAQPSVAAARQRLELVQNPYYYWDFIFNGGCFEATGWGLAALAQSGGSALKIQSVIDTLIANQAYPVGYWYRADNVTYTVHALLGLADAGQAGGERFRIGMDWLEAAYNLGAGFSTTDQALTLYALGDATRWAVFRSNLVANLSSKQNTDGGWGEAAGQASRIDTTAAVVIGFQSTAYHFIALSRGRAFLTAFQNSDGGWSKTVGQLESQTGPTALAVWALAEADASGEIAVGVSTDRNIYASGQTVHVSVDTSVADPERVEGAIVDSHHGTRSSLLFARVDATHFTAQYVIPEDQPSDRFVAEVTVSKGASLGVGSTAFEVGLFRPVNVSPADGAIVSTLTPTLAASDFQSIGATHAASRWQVREASGPSDWSDLTYDSGERTDARTSITIPIGSLRPDVTYAWRVAYKDNTGLWSSWSLPTMFITMTGYSAGIDWLVRHQVALGGWEPMAYLEGWTVELLTESGAKTSPECQLVHSHLVDMQYANGAWPWAETSSLPGLLIYGDSPSAPNLTLGLRALKAGQAANGSWPDSTTNSPDSVEVTAAALRTLALAGEAGSPEALKAVAWFKSIRNSDGGWGGTPGAGSSDFTTLVVRALAMAIGRSDSAVQSGYQFMISHPIPAGGWAKQYELDALVLMGDLTRAQASANQIASIQLPNGAWDFTSGGSGDIGTTALMVSALSRARRAGVTVSSTVTTNAVSFVKNRIQSDGSVLGNGNYARVDLSALALMALLSADQPGEPIQRVRSRFIAHTTPNWYNYFPINGYGTYTSALATAALVSLGDSSALALASSTANQTLLNQKADGSWGALVGSGYPGTASDTINALYGLKRAGRQANSGFDRGVAWLQASPQSGQINNYYKGWLLMTIAEIERFSAYRSNIISSLVAAQNTDGGWGINPGYSSSCEATAAVLLGLDAIDADQTVLARGHAWLLASQNPDAGWGQFAGALASDTRPTALAVWALAETADLPGMVLAVTTDRRSYVGGETATVSATVTVPDVDTIQGSVTDPDGTQSDLAFTKIDSTHYSAQYVISATQWPGAFVVAVNATKGALYGAAARGFEVGLFRPINILPYDQATSISLAPTLRATDFDGSRTLATHVASQWQVRDISSPSDYSSVIFDSGVDTAHLSSITLPLGRLLYSSSYAWTVRYLDSLGRWSAWSIESSFSTIAASQFGERLVFDMDGDIWAMDTAGIGEPARLTAGPARDTCPRISPDGQWIAFSSDQAGSYQVWLMHPDGSGVRPISTFQSGNPICLDWSPASTRLVVSGSGDTIHIVPIDATQPTQIAYYPLVQVRHLAWSTQNKIAVEMSPFGNASYSTICSINPDGTGLISLVSNGHAPAWTPDGSRLAVSIVNDIWTVKANGTGLVQLIRGAAAETVPAWSTDATSLFYRAYPVLNPGVSTIMAAAADGSSTVTLKYYNAAIGTMDIGTIAVGSNLPPAQPALLEPADGATNIPLMATLRTSAFSDPNPGDTHGSTHWQVRLASESYDTAIVNEASATELTQYAVEGGRLVPGQHYFWRVRYADNHGNISPWSAEHSFTTVAGPASVNDRILILAGGGDFTGNAIVEQTKFLAGYAWRLSRNRQVPANQIHLLSAFPTIDADGNGSNDVTAAATRQSLLTALDSTVGFAAGCDKLIIYMVDHGSRTSEGYYFRINPTETISAAELDTALDALQAARPTLKIAVVFDFCYSGGFVIGTQPQAAQQRVCVSGSTQESLAIFNGTIAGVSFSNFFFDNLAAGANFKTAFDTAREGILAAYSGPPMYPLQVPWLEDDGDGRISSKNDGALARTFYWGSTAAYGMTPPQILAVTSDQHVTGSNVKLAAEIAEGFTIERVWATIVSPTSTYVDGQPITTMREVQLVREGTTRVWSAMVGLNELGEHHVTFYARGYDSQTAAVQQFTLQAGTPDSLIAMPRPTVIVRDASRNAVGSSWSWYR